MIANARARETGEPKPALRIEAELRDALSTIRRAWPELDRPQQPDRVDGRAELGARLPIAERILSMRSEITLDLAYWVHSVAVNVEELWGHERMLPIPTTTTETTWVREWVDATVDCRNVPQMCLVLAAHAEWISNWKYGTRMLNEISMHAKEIKPVAWPRERTSYVIGECPVVPEGQGKTACGGQVRLRRREDWAVCRSCRTGAVVKWWRSKMPPPPAEVTADRLVLLLAVDAQTFINEATLRQWRKRGKVESSGHDSRGRRLYRWAPIVEAERERKAREDEKKEVTQT